MICNPQTIVITLSQWSVPNYPVVCVSQTTIIIPLSMSSTMTVYDHGLSHSPLKNFPSGL